MVFGTSDLVEEVTKPPDSFRNDLPYGKNFWLNYSIYTDFVKHGVKSPPPTLHESTVKKLR